MPNERKQKRKCSHDTPRKIPRLNSITFAEENRIALISKNQPSTYS